jgi:hypothetical protein
MSTAHHLFFVAIALNTIQISAARNGSEPTLAALFPKAPRFGVRTFNGFGFSSAGAKTPETGSKKAGGKVHAWCAAPIERLPGPPWL